MVARCAAVCLMILCFASVMFAKKPQTVAKPKTQHAIIRLVKSVSTPAKIAAKALFVVEIPVDGLHAAFAAADKTFDFLSLQGKIPTLDMIYALASVGNTDLGKLDTGIENLEVKLTGTHN
jgi:hypothetical protein